MKILITGGSGLVGLNLIRNLIKDGHKVTTLGRNNVLDCSHINCDFNNFNIKLPTDIDVVFHLAQTEYYREFPEKSMDIFNVNTISTLKLAEWARENNIKKFIYTSSGGIYGNHPKSFVEKDVIRHNNLGFYLGSKLCSEIILDSYKGFFEVYSLRLFFAYGKEQKSNMLIPRLIRNIKMGNPINIDGDKGVIINPIHVSDASKAIKSCLKLNSSGDYNIAGNDILSIYEISETIGHFLSIKPNYNFNKKKSISNKLVGNNEKMKKDLHNPIVKFRDGISKIIHV
jgi:UDP-glucose 4-epimerase|tara:strand:- start:188 stop:1042 length:855 start_codon:yes stop_codon:yes gene_type:complete